MREKVKALCISAAKGEAKEEVGEVRFVARRGIEGDIHGSGGKRQVSLLFEDSVDKMRGEGIDVKPGDMAENILLGGALPENMGVGDIIKINSVRLRVTAVGKECRDMCRIGKKLGSCAMSGEGVFLEVLSSGSAKKGDLALL